MDYMSILKTLEEPSKINESYSTDEYEFDQFLDAYIEAALWSSTDDEGISLDANYSRDDIDPHTLAKMRLDCRKFFTENYDMIIGRFDGAGHDFWLTRNRHGAGFWDGKWKEYGDDLTDSAQSFGECELYVGDDAMLYGR